MSETLRTLTQGLTVEFSFGAKRPIRVKPHLVKVGRAHGGCLGARSRRRTGRTPKCHGELYASGDPWMSEWGNPLTVMGEHRKLNT